MNGDDITRMQTAIEDSQRAIRWQERRIADEVNYALARGASYTEIGAALGISRQAAWERWGPGRERDSVERIARRARLGDPLERWQDHPQVWRDMADK